jgi:hypothetical protein
MKKSYWVAALIIGAVNPSGAQTTTNVAQTVSQLLTAIGPVPYTTTVTYWSECVERGGDPPRVEVSPCPKTKTVTTSNILTASNIAIVSHTDVQFGPPVYTDYPNDLNANFLTIRNCIPVPRRGILQRLRQRKLCFPPRSHGLHLSRFHNRSPKGEAPILVSIWEPLLKESKAGLLAVLPLRTPLLRAALQQPLMRRRLRRQSPVVTLNHG